MRFIKTFQEKKKSTTLHNVKYQKQEGVSKAKKHLQYKSKLATLVKYT